MHRRRARRRLFVATAFLLPSPLFGQTATWVSPVSGSWDAPANWSTDAIPGTGVTAQISATGAPYTVTAATQISPGRVDLDSPDATLDLLAGASNTTLNLAAGAAVFRGNVLDHAVVTGSVPLTVTTGSAAVTDLTLANTLRGTTVTGDGHGYKYIDFYGSLSLDGGTLRMGVALCPRFHENFSITGTGTLTSDLETFSYVYGSAPNLTFGPGITLKTTPGSGDIALDLTSSVTNQPLLYNYGTISSEVPGRAVSVGWGLISHSTTRLSVINGGTLAASNGGTLSVALPAGGVAGNVSLGAGGTVRFDGPDYAIDQPLTVPPTARLQLGGGWKVTAPLTLDGGTLTVASNPTTSCPILYVNSPTVQLTGTRAAASLPLLNTTPSTTIAPVGTIDLGSAPFSFASVPGNWSFPAPVPEGSIGGSTGGAAFKNGTLTDAPGAGNDLLPGGGSVALSGVTVDFPLSVDDGTVFAQSGTTFAHPVTVSGTGRLVLKSFANLAGISATSGVVEFPSAPASPGSISLSGTSTLQLGYLVTLDQIPSLPYGSPGTIAAGPHGTLDLQSATVDLSASPFQIALYGNTSAATLANGSLADPSHAHPLRVHAATPSATPAAGPSSIGLLSNVSCSADIVVDPGVTLRLAGSSLHDSHLSGGTVMVGYGTSSFDSAALDADLVLPYSGSVLAVTGDLSLSGNLSLYPGSVMDLTTSTFLLNYTGSSPADAIRGHILASRLRSSAADDTHRLGYVDDGDSVAVRLTLAGDANLDGRLDADDFALLDKGFAQNASTWWLGDFNYDGVVDASDYLLIDTVYGQTQGFGGGFLSMREAQFGADYVSALLGSVPEPSCLAWGLAAVLAGRRRK